VASPRVAPRSVLWKCQIPSVSRKQVIPPERRSGGCARPGVGPRFFWKRNPAARSLSSPALASHNAQQRRVDLERKNGSPFLRGTGTLSQGSWLDPPGPGEAETVCGHHDRRLPRGSLSILVAVRHPVRSKATHLARGTAAQNHGMPGAPGIGTRKGVACRVRWLGFAPRRHLVSVAPCARSGTDAHGPEESRPKPQGRWTAAPESLRGDRPTRLAAPAVRRENETGKALFTTANSLDRPRGLRAAAVAVGRVRPMRRQEDGGRPVLPPKEEPLWRRKRESTREEAHPPFSQGHEEHLRAQPAEVSGKPKAQARSSPSGSERSLRRSLVPDPRGGLRLLARSPALDSTGSTRHRAPAIMDGEGRREETRGLSGTQPMLASVAQRDRRQDHPAAASASQRFGAKEAAAAPSPRPKPKVRKDPRPGQDLARGPRA
jgi:hypothetical protein